MKAEVSFFGDVHIGNHRTFGGEVVSSINHRCMETIRVFDTAVKRSHFGTKGLTVVHGDLFDTVRPPPQVIAKVMESLAPAEHGRIVLMAGNHEAVSDREDDTALEPFRALRGVSVVGGESEAYSVVDGSTLVVHFPAVRGASMRRTVPEVIGRLLANDNAWSEVIVSMHAGIECDRTPTYLRDSPAAVLLDDLVQLARQHPCLVGVVAGDWHDAFTKVVHVGIERQFVAIQTGSLVPTGFGEHGLNRPCTIAKWSSLAKSFAVSEVFGPRFLSFSTVPRREDLDDAANYSCTTRHSVYVHCEVEARHTDEARSVLADYDGMFRGVRVVPLRSEALEGAAQRSRLLSNEASITNELLGAFLATYPLPPGVTVEEVEEKVRFYLKRSG